jgi:uncharacterized protein (TIGR03437 family)
MQKLKFSAGGFLTALFLFPAFCQAQSISMVSGNGQFVCPFCKSLSTFAPLVVQVNGSTGAPEASTVVTWTITQSGLAPTTATSTTGSNGQASYNFQGASPFFGSSFNPSTIKASALNVSVTFVETVSAPGAGLVPPASAVLLTSSVPPTLTGQTGQLAAPIQVGMYGFGIAGPLAGIGISLQDTVTTSTVICAPQAGQTGQQPDLALTNSSGVATCTPVFGGKVGSGSYTILVGGTTFESFGPSGYSVTAGPPAIIKPFSNATQTVSPGVKAELIALVTDLGGDPSNDAEVTWTVTQGTGTLGAPTSTSGPTGEAANFVTPTVGPVQVTATLTSTLGSKSPVQTTFTVDLNETVTALTIISGNNQLAIEGMPFTNPLVVQVNDGTVPVSGATVDFVVTSGSANLSASSSSGTSPSCTPQNCGAFTNAQGQAEVNVTAGSAPGAVVITASVGYGGITYSQQFSLAVNPTGPMITAVVNAAGFAQAPTASPCSLVTIYGSGLATGLQGVVQPFIAPQYQLAGVTVQFGTPPSSAPILYVANVNGQESLAVQVPCELGLGTAVPLVVTVNNTASPAFGVDVTEYSPGIFTFTDTDNVTRAILVRSDGSLISAANPARPGDILRMFVTGLGQTSPNLATDEFDPLVLDSSNNWVPEVLTVSAQLAVGVDNNGVLIVSQTYSDDMVGVYEVAFQVPENAATGNNSSPFAIGVYYDNGTKLQFGNPTVIPIQ